MGVMPIPCPHFKITIVKRSQGQSAVAGAAYQSGERLFSEYDQKTKFYNKKKELVHAEIMLPSHAPPGYADRATLWNAVEAVENQWNSQLARRIVLAFPVEVPKEQYLSMIKEFCQEQFVSKGMIADFAIHDKGDGNPHAHILLTLRAMDEHGKWLPKARKVYDLDENGERIRLPSGNWKCHKESTVDWNDQKYAEVWRHGWETITNRYLEAAGRPERIDLRSFERQGIQQIPTVHLGPAAHQIYNSTALDGTRKFRDFFFSALAVQRLSDLICLEHQLSVIEIKPYRERQKRTLYPPRESNRDRLCSVIDNILAEKPKDYEDFLQRLEQQGYEVKRGKHTAVKGKGQKRFIRFRTLGTGYSEDEIKAVLEGKAKHQPYQKKQPKEQPFQLLVDIQGKMAAGKSVGYKKWATRFNLKEMSKTLLFLQEQKISSADELRERAAAATERYHAMGDSIKAAEARLTEIAVLKTHIINYAKTRPVYDAYRKSGYSKKYLEAHREEITLHKAAKAAFDEAGLQKLPKVKELDAEFAELLTQKKAAYPDYRKARNEMQELVRAQKNVERFFAEEKENTEKIQTR